MEQKEYVDLDLAFDRQGDSYRVRILDSLAVGTASVFRPPFNDTELENFVLRVGRPRRIARRAESPEMAIAKTFGDRLYRSVFSSALEPYLIGGLSAAEAQGKGLRIRLHLSQTPELADIPWEFLYRSDVNRFLALSERTPIVRYLALPETVRALGVVPPLNVLVAITNPIDHPELDVEREWTKLQSAVADLEKRGLLKLERLAQPTLAGLQRQLRKDEYHVFHFVGHGSFDPKTQEGFLVFEEDDRRGRLVPAQQVGTLLHDERSLQLAVLNACEGGRAGRTDAFAGTAQTLVQQAVPAVIAMQFEITDDAAITLSHEFYSAVADGYPVDAALAEARKAIYAAGSGIEWGTPVLYMRAPDGRIFDVTKLPSQDDPSLVGALLGQAGDAMAQHRWESATNWLDRLLRVDPDNAEAAARLRVARQEQEVLERLSSARECLDAGRLPEALAVLSWLKESRPEDPDVARLDEAVRRAAADVELARQQAMPSAALHQEARAAFDRQDWTGSIEKLQALLRLVGDSAEAQGMLQRAQLQRQLEVPFDRGRKHFEAERWRQAVAELTAVRDRGGASAELEPMIAAATAELARPQPPRPRRWSGFRLLSVFGCLGVLAILVVLVVVFLGIAAQEWGGPADKTPFEPASRITPSIPPIGVATTCVTPQVSCPMVQAIAVGSSCVCNTIYGMVWGIAR